MEGNVQWLWSFNVVSNGVNCVFDQLIAGDSVCSLAVGKVGLSYLLADYMHDMSSVLVLPLFSTIKFYLMSFDVIHSFGINSFGIKLDVIPGTVNSTMIIKPTLLGEFRGG